MALIGSPPNSCLITTVFPLPIEFFGAENHLLSPHSLARTLAYGTGRHDRTIAFTYLASGRKLADCQFAYRAPRLYNGICTGPFVHDSTLSAATFKKNLRLLMKENWCAQLSSLSVIWLPTVIWCVVLVYFYTFLECVMPLLTMYLPVVYVLWHWTRIATVSVDSPKMYNK